MCSEEISAIIAALVGAIVGGIISFLASKLTWQSQSYNQAAAIFRATFVDEIFQLRQRQNDVFRILTSQVMTKYEHAKIIFEPFLKKAEREALEKSWNDFTNYAYAVTTPAPGSLDRRPTDCDKTLENIEKLLKHAQPR